MSNRTQLVSVSLCLCLGILWGCANPDAIKDISSLGQEFQASKDPEFRLRICIQAIDSNFISVGSNVSVLEQLFGKELKRLEPSGDALGMAGVFFIPGQGDKENPIFKMSRREVENGRIPYVGWRFHCSFDANGKITDYYLTDIPG